MEAAEQSMDGREARDRHEQEELPTHSDIGAIYQRQSRISRELGVVEKGGEVGAGGRDFGSSWRWGGNDQGFSRPDLSGDCAEYGEVSGLPFAASGGIGIAVGIGK